MTDFVLQVVQTPNVNEAISWEQTENRLNKIYQYSLFLKQPLTLGMFVPCDESGNVLNDPGLIPSYELEQYRKAKEKVLFEFDGGLTLLRNREWFFIIEDKNGVYYRILKNKTKSKIESVFKFSVDIKLTESAIKQIKL